MSSLNRWLWRTPHRRLVAVLAFCYAALAATVPVVAERVAPGHIGTILFAVVAVVCMMFAVLLYYGQRLGGRHGSLYIVEVDAPSWSFDDAGRDLVEFARGYASRFVIRGSLDGEGDSWPAAVSEVESSLLFYAQLDDDTTPFNLVMNAPWPVATALGLRLNRARRFTLWERPDGRNAREFSEVKRLAALGGAYERDPAELLELDPGSVAVEVADVLQIDLTRRSDDPGGGLRRLSHPRLSSSSPAPIDRADYDELAAACAGAVQDALDAREGELRLALTVPQMVGFLIGVHLGRLGVDGRRLVALHWDAGSKRYIDVPHLFALRSVGRSPARP